MIKINSCINVPKELVNISQLAKHYTYYNKQEQVKTGLSLGVGVVKVPRDISKFTALFPDLAYELQLDTLKVPPKKPLSLKEGFSLKDNQKDVLDELLEHFKTNINAVLQAPCGWGKSYTVGATIVKLQQKTLLLADRTTLVEQLFEELSANVNADIKILSKNNLELGDINICTLQFLNKRKELIETLKNNIGFVILDECHVSPADTFCKIVQEFPAHYRLGLSATPTRSDGLTNILTDVFGSFKTIGLNDSQPFKTYFIEPHITVRADINKFLPDVARRLREPNILELIVKICEISVSKNRVVFIASDTKENQELYKSILVEKGLTAEVVNSNTTPNERRRIFRECDEGKINVLIGFGVLEKGISIKRLDTLVLAVTAITKEKLQQVVGRLLRTHKDAKSPIIFDIQPITNGTSRNAKLRWYRSQSECTLGIYKNFTLFSNSLS